MDHRLNSNPKPCNYYKQKGECRLGNDCRYKHVPNILSLPAELLSIILNDQYVSDIRQVCREFRYRIDTNYPLKLFLFNGVMNGVYTSGCAMSIARCFNDAVFQISIRALNSNNTPWCGDGLWDRYSGDRKDPMEIINDKKLTDSSFRIFYRKFQNLVYTPKITVNSRSGNEMNITKILPKKYSFDQKYKATKIYFELRDRNVNILPLDKSMGFYNGGGD